MPDLRYLDAKDKFLNYAFDVFHEYYPDRDIFNQQFDAIPTDSEKNLFLMIASFYKFLVKDGAYVCEDPEFPKRIGYIDETYKYIAIMALIEAMYTKDKYVEFYKWLMRKAKSESKIFPITNQAELQELYNRYKAQHGATRKALAFFQSLDDSVKRYVTTKITVDRRTQPIKSLAKLLYQIRSDFLHHAKLVLEFGAMTALAVFSKRDQKTIQSSFTIDDMKLIFESGVLKRFGFSPQRRRI